MDAGMQYDKIELKYENQKAETFIYEFDSGALKIFRINCITFDTENNYCVEIEKGELKYLLKKH
jgi:hypothetical protein